MELSFSTQQPAIFLNETDFITPYLKPSKNFSLHGDKIQTAYHLQGKAWMICNLSLFGLLFTTSQTYLSLGLKAFVLALFCSYSLSPNLCMMVCLSFSSQLKWQCLRVAFPNYPWPKHDSPNHSSHMFLLLFLQSPHQYKSLTCYHVNYLSWPTRT